MRMSEILNQMENSSSRDRTTCDGSLDTRTGAGAAYRDALARTLDPRNADPAVNAEPDVEEQRLGTQSVKDQHRAMTNANASGGMGHDVSPTDSDGSNVQTIPSAAPFVVEANAGSSVNDGEGIRLPILDIDAQASQASKMLEELALPFVNEHLAQATNSLDTVEADLTPAWELPQSTLPAGPIGLAQGLAEMVAIEVIAQPQALADDVSSLIEALGQDVAQNLSDSAGEEGMTGQNTLLDQSDGAADVGLLRTAEGIGVRNSHVDAPNSFPETTAFDVPNAAASVGQHATAPVPEHTGGGTDQPKTDAATKLTGFAAVDLSAQPGKSQLVELALPRVTSTDVQATEVPAIETNSSPQTNTASGVQGVTAGEWSTQPQPNTESTGAGARYIDSGMSSYGVSADPLASPLSAGATTGQEQAETHVVTSQDDRPAKSEAAETLVSTIGPRTALATRSEVQGPNAPLPDSDVQRLVERVANAVRQSSRDGGTLQIRLNPPELGALHIEVAIRDGLLSAKLEVQTTAARQALSDNLAQLRDSIAQTGAAVDRIDVQLAQSRRDDGQSPLPNHSQQQERDSNQQHANQQRDQQHHRRNSQTESEQAGQKQVPRTNVLNMDQLDIQI